MAQAWMRSSVGSKIFVSGVLLGLGVVRFWRYSTVKDRMDGIFLSLVISAVVLWLVPWHQLKSLKAGGVEISLQQPEVQAAISGLGLDRVEDGQLRQKLLQLRPDLQSVRGSKVLWIDDKPQGLLPPRRLLRVLGVSITSATSTAMAEEFLKTDNDFDLLITDVQRLGDSHKDVGGVPIHEGVNFVVKLRKHGDVNIRSLPVIFYAAYPWDKLVVFTRPARELAPEADISNSAIDFIPKVIRRLAQERAKPIAYTGFKKATGTGPA